MKKNKRSKLSNRISPEEAVRFLEDIRLMRSEVDEPTAAISIRVPENILRAIRLKAKTEGKKYQSLMVEFMRRGLKESR
jgi:predicted DNA binding CopG/RHH family protein